jgi:hypothetical protein
MKEIVARLKLIAAAAEVAAIKAEQGKFWEGDLASEVNRLAGEVQALQRIVAQSGSR